MEQIEQREGEGDEEFMRRFMLAHILERQRENDANRGKVLCSTETAERHFWDGMSDEERLAVKRYLVDSGIASWAYEYAGK